MTKQEITNLYDSKYAEELLGSPLIPSDCHDYDEDEDLFVPMMTKDQMFYFAPVLDDPVMSDVTILDNIPKPIPNRYHWTVEVLRCFPGGHWDPDEYDFVEVDRGNSLRNAIVLAAHYNLDQKINGTQEYLYHEEFSELEKGGWVENVYD